MQKNEARLKSVQRFGQTVDRLVEPFLDFSAYHHAHHHVKVGMQHQTYSGVVGVDFVQLDPEGEVYRHASLIAYDLHVFGLDPLLYAQSDVESLDAERQLSASACQPSTLSCKAGVSMSRRESSGNICLAEWRICLCCDSYFSIIVKLVCEYS